MGNQLGRNTLISQIQWAMFETGKSRSMTLHKETSVSFARFSSTSRSLIPVHNISQSWSNVFVQSNWVHFSLTDFNISVTRVIQNWGQPQRSFRLSLFCSSLIHSWQHQCSVAQKQFSNWNIKVKQWEIHSATMHKYSWPSLRLENPGRTHSLPGEKEASASLGLFPNSSCPSSQTTKMQKVCGATFLRKYNVKVFPILQKYQNMHPVFPWVSFHNLPSWF